MDLSDRNKKINIPWSKKNTYQLIQKPENNKVSLSNSKYTKTRTLKTVTPSSSWSSTSSSTGLLRKNKILTEINKSRTLKKIL